VATKRKAADAGAQTDFGFAPPGALDPVHNRLTAWAPGQWPVDPGWAPLLQAFWASPQGRRLGDFMAQRLAAGATIYPSQPLRALELTPLPAVRIVILGQDPYHGPNQAHGLAFSVQHDQRVPPSLRNIFSEIERGSLPQPAPCLQARAPRSGALEPWAWQGVLLLNTCLTVESGAPGSHAKQGWEALTDKIIKAIACSETPTVFMLWGAHAQAKQDLIGTGWHLVLTANHPSPLSARRPPRPFVGCGHFSAANAWLEQHGLGPVLW
jgi:uracil-DNA glycosylase